MLVFVVGCAPKPDSGVVIKEPGKPADGAVAITPDAQVSKPLDASKAPDGPTSSSQDKSKPSVSLKEADAQLSQKAKDAAKDLEDMDFFAYPAAEVKAGAYRTDSSAGVTVGSTWTTPDDIDLVAKHLSAALKLTAKSGVKRAESDSRLLAGTTRTGNKVTLSIVRGTGAKVTEIQVTVTGKPKG